jgi:hypothetical protein
MLLINIIREEGENAFSYVFEVGNLHQEINFFLNINIRILADNVLEVFFTNCDENAGRLGDYCVRM